ncbi:MAG TPA: 2-C-methyl-D-erythritol 4-phosphate cytidylyltransferase [Ktedonobacterales bacterium]|nr:2-C-methyl-D-erythritol 4-phosphate cytidylyltransferase [Ktedonobacterales bacterium]
MARVVAVILCAGQGTRMGAGENKVFLPLAGQPALLWSVEAFERAASVDEVLLVAHPGEMARVREVAASAQPRKVIGVVAGGATRAGSERRALAALRARIESGEIGLVMIHDGARPLVTPEEIERLAGGAQALDAPGGALLAAPVGVDDEIGEAGPDGRLERLFTPGELARAQTPQAFDARLLLGAYERAETGGFDGTDTASTVERVGALVLVVTGSEDNLKLTTADDLPRAEAIMRGRTSPLGPFSHVERGSEEGRRE